MIVVDHLESISTKYEFSATVLEPLVQTCRTTLSSKIRRRGYGALSSAHSMVICRAVRATCREATVPGDDVSGRRLVRTRRCCAGRRGSRAGRRRGCLAASCAAVEDTAIQGRWWPWMRGGHVIGSRDCRDTGVGWGFPNFSLPVKHGQPM